MAAKLIMEKEGSEFIEKLENSPLLSIVYHAGLKSGTIQIQLELARSVSTLIKDYNDEHPDQHQVFSHILLRHSGLMLEKVLVAKAWTYSDQLWKYFFSWIHTGLLKSNAAECTWMWYFGQSLGAPLFQNSAMRNMFLHASIADDSFDIYKRISLCVDLSDMKFRASVWKPISDVETYWKENRLLKFLLDVIIYRTSEEMDDGTVNIMEIGGPLAVYLVKRIYKKVTSKEKACAPWDASKISEYLFEEKKTAISLAEETGSLPSTEKQDNNEAQQRSLDTTESSDNQAPQTSQQKYNEAAPIPLTPSGTSEPKKRLAKRKSNLIKSEDKDQNDSEYVGIDASDIIIKKRQRRS